MNHGWRGEWCHITLRTDVSDVVAVQQFVAHFGWILPLAFMTRVLVFLTIIRRILRQAYACS